MYQLLSVSQRQYTKMAHTVCVVVMACFITCCSSAFTFKECATKHPILRVHSINISDPIEIPGDVTISADLRVLQSLGHGHSYTASLLLNKMMFGTYVRIPCIWNKGHIGNCSLGDVCTALSDTWVARNCPITHKNGHATTYNCSCPVSPATYSIIKKTYSLSLAALDGALGILAQGEYQVHVDITDNHGKIVYCADANVTTVAGCTGSSCVLG